MEGKAGPLTHISATSVENILNDEQESDFFAPSSPNTSPSLSDHNSKGLPEACLFVASLSQEISEESLRTFFQHYGNIMKIKLIKERSMRPYAFIQYHTPEEASLALQHANNKLLDGRRLRVEKAKVNRTLFIAKINKSLGTLALREVMEQYGPVESVTIIKNHQTNKSKGCGFVKFVYREDASDAFVGLKTAQPKWVVEWATSTNDPDSLGIDKCNIFIGGLNPLLITKETIQQRFGVYGEIESITLINKDSKESPDGERTAYAFIRYNDPAASSNAIEQENGTEWLDRRIRVQYCESAEMKSKRRNTKLLGEQPLSPTQYYSGRVQNPINPIFMMGGFPQVFNVPSPPAQQATSPFASRPKPASSTPVQGVFPSSPFVGYPIVSFPPTTNQMLFTQSPSQSFQMSQPPPLSSPVSQPPFQPLHLQQELSKKRIQDLSIQVQHQSGGTKTLAPATSLPLISSLSDQFSTLGLGSSFNSGW